MVAEVSQTFWSAMARGEFITGAAAEAGTYRAKGRRWLRESGGVRPSRGRDLKGRCLTFAEREEIAIGHAWGGCPPDRPGSGPLSVDGGSLGCRPSPSAARWA